MKNSQKGSVIIWAIVIIVVILVVAIVFYLYKSGERQPTEYQQQAQAPTTNVATTTVISESQTGVKVFPCDNSFPTKETNTNRKVSVLKVINYELSVYLNNHPSYPTSLAYVDNNGTKEDYSGAGYLYAYYPKVNPTHYHLGMKIQYGAACNNTLATYYFKTKANFNSISAGYTNGFDGTNADTIDFHDSQNN